MSIATLLAQHNHMTVTLDGEAAYKDAIDLEKVFGFTPKIMLRAGLRTFAEGYKSYCK